MEHLQASKVLSVLLIGMFLICLVGAKIEKPTICVSDDGEIIRCNSKLKNVEKNYQEVDLEKDKLIVKEDGLYKNQDKIKNKKDSSVYIHKSYVRDGIKYYHVDNLNDEQVDIYLEFEYAIQPYSITHYDKNDKLTKVYYKGQDTWNWLPDCEGEDCEDSSGTLRLYVSNISANSIGSDVFQGGLDSPYSGWVVSGDYYGEFNGSSYVDLDSISSINKSQNYSIASWFYSKNDINQTIAFSNVLSSSDRHLIGLQNGSVKAGYYNGSDYTSKTGTYNTGAWNNVILINTDGVISLYINSVVATTDVDAFSPSTTAGASIGSNSDYSANFFNGSIDEVIVYNRSLNSTDITTLYNSYSVGNKGVTRTSNPSSDGLILDINFDDASTGDNSGNDNSGIPYGIGFGQISLEEIDLTQTTDYTLTDGLLTVVNDDYLNNYLLTEWTYEIKGYSENMIDDVKEGTGSFFSNTTIWMSLLSLVIIILIVAIILGSIKLFGSDSKGSEGGVFKI